MNKSNVIKLPVARAQRSGSAPAPFGVWIKQMEQVRAHMDNIREKNAATIALNRDILRKHKLEYPDTIPRLSRVKNAPIHPMPLRAESWVKPLLERESQVLRDLKAKTPEAWAADIGNLLPPVRNRVACLVWWDYFSHRNVTEAWPHLDKYIKCPFVNVPDEQVIRALHKVGYSPTEATRRATTEDGGCDEGEE